MNRDKYDEIINGTETYQDIANKLKEGKSVIIGWTDLDCAHFDLLFNLKPYKEMGNILQRGLSGNELYVSIMNLGAFGFDVSFIGKDKDYIAEKLNVYRETTKTKLAELINKIMEELLSE